MSNVYSVRNNPSDEQARYFASALDRSAAVIARAVEDLHYHCIVLGIEREVCGVLGKAGILEQVLRLSERSLDSKLQYVESIHSLVDKATKERKPKANKTQLTTGRCAVQRML